MQIQTPKHHPKFYALNIEKCQKEKNGMSQIVQFFFKKINILKNIL